MKKNIIWGVAGLLILIISVFWFWPGKDGLKLWGSPFEALAQDGVVVEVIKGQVTVELAGREKVLNAPVNQEIDKGAVLTTAAASQANIIFPSGSVARLEENTTVSLVDFVSGREEVLVKFKLESGNLWSRVQRLTDKSTEYEVKTSNTVAVVKGTSFNAFFSGDKTKVHVLNKEVIVAALDPLTGQLVAGGRAEVSAGNFVQIDSAALPSEQAPLTPQVIPPWDLEQTWFEDNLDKDSKIDRALEKFGNRLASNQAKEFLSAVVTLGGRTFSKESLIKEGEVSEKKEEIKETPTPSLTPEISPSLSPSPSVTPSPKPIIQATPLKLSISSISPSSGVGRGYQYTNVTIKGDGFTAQTRGRVGQWDLQNIKLVDKTTLTGTVPAEITAGKHDVVLTDGSQQAVLASAFTVLEPVQR